MNLLAAVYGVDGRQTLDEVTLIWDYGAKKLTGGRTGW